MTSQDWILYFLLGPFLVLSKQNQQTWDLAQRYSGRLSLWLFIGLSVVELPLFIFIETPNAGLISTGLLVIACMLLFLGTERHLKRKHP